jgi:hypothetical protein
MELPKVPSKWIQQRIDLEKVTFNPVNRLVSNYVYEKNLKYKHIKFAHLRELFYEHVREVIEKASEPEGIELYPRFGAIEVKRFLPKERPVDIYRTIRYNKANKTNIKIYFNNVETEEYLCKIHYIKKKKVNLNKVKVYSLYKNMGLYSFRPSKILMKKASEAFKKQYQNYAIMKRHIKDYKK